jgi:replicative DNA helicase
VRGISTGWQRLDAKIGGWKSGLHVILGASHIGKSWVTMTTLFSAARTQHHVNLFSLEMSAKQLARRWGLASAGITQRDYELGWFEEPQLRKMIEEQERFKNYDNITIYEAEVSDITSIVATMMANKRKGQLDLAGIDYLGLIDDHSGNTRNETLGNITRQLHIVSQVLDIPLLVPHQISDKKLESREDKRPRSADAYESGHIKMNVDALYGIYRDDVYYEDSEKQNILEISVLKDRLGGATAEKGVGPAELYFHPTGRITDIEYRTEP